MIVNIVVCVACRLTISHVRGNHAASLRRLPRVFSFLFLFIILQFLLKDPDRPGIHAGMVGCRVDRGLFPSLRSALAVGFRFSFCVCMCVYVQRLSFFVNYKHYIHFFYRYLAVFFLDLPCWDAYVKANSAEMVGRPLKRSTRPVSAMFEI